MSLRDFLSLHREELIRACKTELSRDTNIEQLARELCELLEQPNSPQQSEQAPSPLALLGEDPAIRRVRASIEQLARRSRTPVLFLGEVGTGRRHCARLLHADTYPDGEFLELNGDAELPLLERKLAALRLPSSRHALGGMSVFVHELGDTSKAVQAVLTQLIREHGLRFRLMASSRVPPSHASREGLLRSDLVFGFSTTVELPNLRDRPNDLPILLAHFTARRAGGRVPLTFSESAVQALKAYTWPGNLTELSQLVERLQQLDGPRTIEPEHLSELAHRRSDMVVKLPPNGIDLADLERELLLQALALTENNRSRAARLLGLTRDQIRYRMGKLQLASGGDED